MTSTTPATVQHTHRKTRWPLPPKKSPPTKPPPSRRPLTRASTSRFEDRLQCQFGSQMDQFQSKTQKMLDNITKSFQQLPLPAQAPQPVPQPDQHLTTTRSRSAHQGRPSKSLPMQSTSSSTSSEWTFSPTSTTTITSRNISTFQTTSPTISTSFQGQIYIYFILYISLSLSLTCTTYDYSTSTCSLTSSPTTFRTSPSQSPTESFTSTSPIPSPRPNPTRRPKSSPPPSLSPDRVAQRSHGGSTEDTDQEGAAPIRISDFEKPTSWLVDYNKDADKDPKHTRLCPGPNTGRLLPGCFLSTVGTMGSWHPWGPVGDSLSRLGWGYVPRWTPLALWWTSLWDLSTWVAYQTVGSCAPMQILPADVRHPFMLRLSCHVRQPGVILP